MHKDVGKPKDQGDPVQTVVETGVQLKFVAIVLGNNNIRNEVDFQQVSLVEVVETRLPTRRGRRTIHQPTIYTLHVDTAFEAMSGQTQLLAQFGGVGILEATSQLVDPAQSLVEINIGQPVT